MSTRNIAYTTDPTDDTKDTAVTPNTPLPVTLTTGAGSSAPLTAFGDSRVAELSPQFQSSFEYTVDNTEININTVVGSGSVTQATALAIVGSGSTTGSSAALRSKRHAKYRAGLGGLMRFTASFTAGVAGTYQYAGIVDADGSSAAFNNGLAVGFDGDTFGFHRFAGDVKYSVPISSWDDPLDGTGASGQTIDTSKINIFYIQFGYLGVLGPMLWFVGQDNVPYKVHTIPTAGILDVPTSYNPNYQFTLKTDNGATTSDLVVKCSSYAYFIEGKTSLIELHQPQFSSGKQSKSSVTTETAIFTIRNKSTYAGKSNYLELQLEIASAAIEIASAAIEAGSASNLGEVRLIKNATLGGTPSWSDINTTNSIVEIDTSGTTVTGGEEILFSPLAGKNDRASQDLTTLKIIIESGETVTIAGSSANSATINASLLWKELF